MNKPKTLSDKQKAYLQNPERTKKHPWRLMNNVVREYTLKSMRKKELSKKPF